MSYVAGLRECITRETLDGRTPKEVITSQSPDISEYTEYALYSWCYFYDIGTESRRTLARWLGPSCNIGQVIADMLRVESKWTSVVEVIGGTVNERRMVESGRDTAKNGL
jgi:hypothetical protein